jgi:hypothetical protein
VKYWQTALAILAWLSAPFALADEFKTNNGKEYKNATVTQVEADGIVVKRKTGISKLYFTELPEDVRKQYHYDPVNAAAAQAAAARQTEAFNKQAEELDKQRKAADKERQKAVAEQQAKQQNVQALVDRLAELQQQEENLLAEIGRIESAQTVATRKWIDQGNQPYVDPGEANLPMLEGRLQNVRDEKERVRKELERAQHESQ